MWICPWLKSQVPSLPLSCWDRWSTVEAFMTGKDWTSKKCRKQWCSLEEDCLEEVGKHPRVGSLANSTRSTWRRMMKTVLSAYSAAFCSSTSSCRTWDQKCRTSAKVKWQCRVVSTSSRKSKTLWNLLLKSLSTCSVSKTWPKCSRVYSWAPRRTATTKKVSSSCGCMRPWGYSQTGSSNRKKRNSS